MRTFSAVIEKCNDTGLFVGYIPGFPGAHSQGETIDDLRINLKEVIEMLNEDHGLGLLMKEADRNDKANNEAVLKKLRENF
jgi:predicted RNase H-like HicB family nuclease